MPVDNTRTIGFLIEAVDPADQEKVSTFSQAKEGRTAGPQEAHRDYKDTQRNPDDKEAQVSQRPIAVHALEHLGSTDRGVILFRKILKRAIKDIQEGRDPQNASRTEGLINVIAGNTVS